MPQVIYAQRETHLAPGAVFGPVIRDYFIFECCESGSGAVEINGREFPVSAGDFYVLFPGDTIVHKASHVDPRKGYYCSFLGLSLEQVLARAGISSEQPFAPPELFESFREMMRHMTESMKQNDFGAPIRASACLCQILGTLLQSCEEIDRGDAVQKAIGMMEARYHEALSATELADFVGLERSYFSSLFHRETGLPPHRYLTRLRVRKACALLELKDTPVSVAAESVGLDPQNFSRMFKRETGLTPLQYRKKQLGKDSL